VGFELSFNKRFTQLQWQVLPLTQIFVKMPGEGCNELVIT
jgi:hypothetical protein